MLWLVQNGSSHFWYDNWQGSGALFLKTPVASYLSFRDFITQRHWNAQLLAQVLPRDVMSLVLGKPVLSEQIADEAVWMPERSGKFSLASAYHEVRHVGNTSVMLSRVWQCPTPRENSIFSWFDS